MSSVWLVAFVPMIFGSRNAKFGHLGFGQQVFPNNVRLLQAIGVIHWSGRPPDETTGDTFRRIETHVLLGHRIGMPHYMATAICKDTGACPVDKNCDVEDAETVTRP